MPVKPLDTCESNLDERMQVDATAKTPAKPQPLSPEHARALQRQFEQQQQLRHFQSGST